MGSSSNPSPHPGRVLQHQKAPGASIRSPELYTVAQYQQDALHRLVHLHPQLSCLCVQPSWNPQSLRHRRHGELVSSQTPSTSTTHPTIAPQTHNLPCHNFPLLSLQIPRISPIRLNTKTFGTFIPQVIPLSHQHDSKYLY